jgi:hypothetical protein
LLLHVSQCAFKSKRDMYAYRIGKTIILPHVRYITDNGSYGMMFHSEVVRSHGRCQTVGCDRTDVSGLCSGHKMSKEDFLRRYCDGVEPEVQINNEGRGGSS